MENAEYQITQLLPQIGLVFEGDFSSPEGLSAIVVAFLLVLAGLFAIFSTISFFMAKKHLRFYRSLIKGMSSEQLLDKRRDLVNQAFEKKDSFGKLWREFDESLVIIKDKDRLCNTLDAAHFFNTHSMARGLTENRLLSAVPGFLTAIGVLGTFAGLQMGLAGLEVTSDDVDLLKTGISTLIGGASIAFMTSVWGVLTSVIFNFYEKILERSIRTSITRFQNEMDYLYPRITAEQSLSNIEETSRQSFEKLAELDEKIGHKMQEAMREASTVISQSVADSLNTILGPAIQKIANDAHSGSEKALEGLLDRYLDGVGNAGKEQKIALENASHNLKSATDGMTEGLNSFSNKLDTRMESFLESQKSSILDMEAQLKARLEEQNEHEQARQDVMRTQFTALQGSQGRLTDSVQSMIDHQSQQYTDIQEGLETLLSSFSELASAQQEATRAMQQSSSDMNATSNQLGLLSGNLKQTAEELGGRIQSAVELIVQAGEQQQSTLRGFAEFQNSLNQLREQMQGTAETLNQAAQSADNGMNSIGKHFDALGEALKKHISELQDQVSNLLEEYMAKVQGQTSDRLNTWNEQTNAYISSMTDAVGALSGVVDDIETKMGK